MLAGLASTCSELDGPASTCSELDGPASTCSELDGPASSWSDVLSPLFTLWVSLSNPSSSKLRLRLRELRLFKSRPGFKSFTTDLLPNIKTIELVIMILNNR